MFVLQTGDRFDSRSINSRDAHPSGVPRPGRGRGRPHGKGNNYGGIGHDSDYGASKWSMNENDGLSTFPGAKVNNSPGKDPWGWGSGRGNTIGDSGSGGDWAGGHADRNKGGWREGSGTGGRGRGAWGVGNGAGSGWAGNVGGRGGWSGGSDLGGRTGEELANPNGSAAGFAASTGWSDSRR